MRRQATRRRTRKWRGWSPVSASSSGAPRVRTRAQCAGAVGRLCHGQVRRRACRRLSTQRRRGSEAPAADHDRQVPAVHLAGVARPHRQEESAVRRDLRHLGEPVPRREHHRRRQVSKAGGALSARQGVVRSVGRRHRRPAGEARLQPHHRAQLRRAGLSQSGRREVPESADERLALPRAAALRVGRVGARGAVRSPGAGQARREPEEFQSAFRDAVRQLSPT